MDYDEACFIIKDMIDYLNRLDPDDFDQNDFFDAIQQARPCGCIAAHSYWQEFGKLDYDLSLDSSMSDTSVWRAVECILEAELGRSSSRFRPWAGYIFEHTSVIPGYASVLGVKYTECKHPKHAAERLRIFLKHLAGIGMPERSDWPGKDLEDVV